MKPTKIEISGAMAAVVLICQEMNSIVVLLIPEITRRRLFI
jgi:hypothetical protein